MQTNDFGLIPRHAVDSPDNASILAWEDFAKHVAELNSTAFRNERFCVLFLGRHGEGWHNVGEAKYGTVAWDVGREIFSL